MGLTVGSLFAGIGGFDHAARTVGWTTKWYSEIDPYACQVMAQNFPEAINLGDVRGISRPPAVDVLCGGFPCQDISHSGKGAGLSGARSGLWRQFARIIDEIRPTWIVIENASALRTRGLGTVLRDLDAVGYVGEWHCVSACAVGAPHQRDRAWIIARRATRRDDWIACDACGEAWCAICEMHVGECSCIPAEQWEALADAMCLRTQISDSGQLAAEQEPGRNGTTGGVGFGPAEYWATQPRVDRVSHGTPHRWDRTRCAGNAIVPQIAEVIFRAINQFSLDD